MKLQTISVLCLLTLTMTSARGVQSAQEVTDAPATSTGGASDYRVGPGDLLEIKVFGVDSLDQEVRISSSGNISVPLLGKLQVGGMTGEEVETIFAQTITEQGLIRDPQVSVFVKEYRSQPLYVLGAVNQPGQYMITHQLTLVDAIAMAGGLAAGRSADYVLLQRHGVASESQDGLTEAGLPSVPAPLESEPGVIRIDLPSFLEKGNLALNVPVQGGDVIHVPERQVSVFYVVGEVMQAGAYQFPNERDRSLLVTQAISKAGGPGRTAKLSKGMLVRYDETGARTELAVNFKAILQGKNPDLPVFPNDIIFIPGSSAKSLAYAFLNIVPQTTSSILIWQGIRK